MASKPIFEDMSFESEDDEDSPYFKISVNDVKDAYEDNSNKDESGNIKIPEHILSKSIVMPYSVPLEKIMIYGTSQCSGKQEVITFDPKIDNDDKVEKCFAFIRTHNYLCYMTGSLNEIPEETIPKLRRAYTFIAASASQVWAQNIRYDGESYIEYHTLKKHDTLNGLKITRKYILSTLLVHWTLRSKNFFWFLCLMDHITADKSRLDEEFVDQIHALTYHVIERSETKLPPFYGFEV